MLNLTFTKAINRVLSVVFTPFAKVWSFMRRVIPGLKKLTTLRPEVLACVLSFIFALTVIIVHALIVFVWTPNPEPKESYVQNLPTFFILLFAIPFFMYLFVRLLLAPPKSPFPEIDLAFDAGLTALQKNGISIRETPVYLVLGVPDSRKIKQLMTLSGRTFDFSHVTADGQALHWYGSADSTFVFLSGVGNTCQLTEDLAKYVSQTGSEDDEYADTGDFRGTIDVRALAKGGSEFSAPAEEDVANHSIKSTIKVGDLHSKPQLDSPAQTPEPDTEFKENRTQLSSREKLAEQKRRLKHLCELMVRHRKPVCAINGIIVSMVNRLVEEFPGQLARQTKSDLETISQTTGVICTVTAIITGFETDEGCREFVDRLRSIHGDEFLKRRFGKSYRSWESPTAAHLKEVSNESVENFDQYIYSIFTQHDALSSQHVNGNRDMVKFLCWIYARFFEGLETTLMSGFNVEGNEDFPRFAGCYFMGIGGGGNMQFFGEGVFDRVEENQGELEWSSTVLQREETLAMASQLVFLMGLVALVVFGVMVWRQSKTDAESNANRIENAPSQMVSVVEQP